MKLINNLTRTFCLLCLLMMSHITSGQELQADGIVYRVNREAGHQDFIIPSSIDPATGYNRIDFYLRGGDGGRRRISGICTEPGGEGATILASFEIGTEDGQLEPGGTIRFILGEQGNGFRGSSFVGAGGGGGSAILYQRPGLTSNSCTQRFYEEGGGSVRKPVPSTEWNTNCWILLMVAGGGGGAYAPGGCAQASSGKGGNNGEDGTDGKDPAGEAGRGGTDGRPGSKYIGWGGGGSRLRDFDGKTGEAGSIVKGRGGKSDGFSSTRGGDGFGGGGSGFRGVVAGGGGGGGFSGGGGGGFYEGGGGGGSFVNSYGTNVVKREGGKDKTPDNGFVTYQFGVGSGLLEAKCKDVTIALSEGTQTLLPEDVDDGSGVEVGEELEDISFAARTSILGVPIYIPVPSLSFDCDDIGEQTRIFRVKSTSGNEDYCAFTVNVVDEVAPSVSCTPFTILAQINNGQDYSLPIAMVEESASDNCGQITEKVLSKSVFTCADVGTTQTVTLYVEDDSDNTGSCTVQVDVIEVGGVPSVTCPSNIVDIADPGTCSKQLMEGLAPADQGGNCSSVLSYAISQPAGGINVQGNGILQDFDFQLGTSTITYSVADGNTIPASCSFTVTIEESNSLSVTCPSNIVSLAAEESCTISLTSILAPLSQVGNCNSSLTYVIDQPPGAIDVQGTGVLSNFTFQTGTSTVTYTVSDDNAQAASCSFTVSIEDLEAPVARCQNRTISPGTLIINMASFIDDGSSDNCQITHLSANASSFGCGDVGENAVVLTVRDGSGNESTCTSIITVTDNVPPVVICQDITVDLDAAGNASITTSDVENGFFDNCGSVGLSLSRNTFDCTDVGSASVTLTATDGSGNTHSCTAIISVTGGGEATISMKPNVKLWPPDYNYQTFALSDMVSSVTGGCGNSGLESMWIEGVISDEPEDDPSPYDGSTLNDILIAADCQSIQLRRERNAYGNGRVYTITLAYPDASGGISYTDYEVSVPRWPWGWYSNAVKDAAVYTVECGAESGAAVLVENGTSFPAVEPSGRARTGHLGNSPMESMQLSAYPNPFHSKLNIRFHLVEAGFASLEVFDLQGRRLKQLLSAELYTGQHEATWNGTDNGGQNLPSGLYFIRLTVGGEVLIQKVLLQRE